MNFSEIIDISWPISQDMTAYKDRSIVQFVSTKTVEKDGARETLITIGSHSGTHVDAPAHFVHGGATVDQIALDYLNGSCRVYDLSHCDEKITRSDLEAIGIKKGDRVLLKTKNSLHAPTDQFAPKFVYLAADAAQFLVECQIKVVGIDYLGIERNQPGHETHKVLLEHNIPIIEGLRLGLVTQGNYFLVCLPLLLPGLDAAPVRAILFR